ncbi:MAG: CHASE2 domain-containing protein [Pseudomonadota bacterium]
MAKNMFAQRFRWLSALPLLAVTLALAVIAVGALSGAQSSNAFGREALFDFYQRLRPASSETASPFHVVHIDRESVAAVGPWPWPRSIIADLVATAADAGARGVVLVEPVDAPDPLSPAVIGEFWLEGARDEELGRQLALLPSTDAALADAFAGTTAAAAIAQNLAAAPTATENFERADTSAAPWIEARGAGGDYFALPKAAIRFPVSADIARSAQLAVAGLPEDADGVFRRTPLYWSVDGVPTPLAGFEAARLAASGAAVGFEAKTSAVNAAGRSLGAIDLGDQRIDLFGNGVIRFYGPKRFAAEQTSAARLLAPNASNSQLRDKVVLIGLDRDLGGAVKFARGAVSRTEAHALIAAQVNAGAFVKRPDWIGYAEAIVVMLLGAAAIMWSQKLDFWKALGIAFAASAFLFASSFSAFATGDLLFNPLPGALALFLGAFSVAGGRSLGVVLRDDSVRGTFHGGLPEPAMKKIREDGATDLLEGVKRPVSVLACELRILDEDLVRLSAHPDDVTNMMAAASNALRKTIIETGGAADQAEGGKIFAYFNAPLENADHIDAACSSALRLVESMDKINAELEASTRTRGVQLHLAIGIAVGDCFVGPMGHGRANRYSALGPAVEMASFLRKQAEFYGPAIICDEPVYRHTHHHFAYLELDRLKTNKTDQPVSIYALVGNPFIKSSKSYRSLDEAHRQLLSAYRAGDWAAARTMLKKVKESPGAAIAVFDVYEERIEDLAANGAPPDWDGAHPVTI